MEPAPIVTIPEESHPYRVFVYGTLKSGEGNHHLLKKVARFQGNETLNGYVMIHLGGFPAIIKYNPQWNVHGEVWDVTADTLARLDILEGVGHGMYIKATCELPYSGKSFVYVMPETRLYAGVPFIPSGRWFGKDTPMFKWKPDQSPGHAFVEVFDQWRTVRRQIVVPPTTGPTSSIPHLPALPKPVESKKASEPVHIGPGVEEA